MGDVELLGRHPGDARILGKFLKAVFKLALYYIRFFLMWCVIEILEGTLSYFHSFTGPRSGWWLTSRTAASGRKVDLQRSGKDFG